MLIQRVTESSLQTWAETIMERLKEPYGARTQAEMVAFLRGCIISPEYYFVHTANAIALAQRVRGRLTTRPDIEEIFVLAADKTNPEHIEECAEIYRDIYQWGKNARCRDFMLEFLSDLPRAKIKEIFAGHRMRILEIPFVEIKQ